jgi:hypothetical protein
MLFSTINIGVSNALNSSLQQTLFNTSCLQGLFEVGTVHYNGLVVSRWSVIWFDLGSQHHKNYMHQLVSGERTGRHNNLFGEDQIGMCRDSWMKNGREFSRSEACLMTACRNRANLDHGLLCSCRVGDLLESGPWVTGLLCSCRV